MLRVGILLLAFVVLYGIYGLLSRWMLRAKVLQMHESFLSREEFLARWKDELSRKEESGCYALFFYKKYTRPAAYDSVYIGQSQKIYHRLHQHLTGRGNVLAKRFMEQGYRVLCCPLPASLWRMNEYEKQLIRAFRANLYGLNRTAGGAKRRY